MEGRVVATQLVRLASDAGDWYQVEMYIAIGAESQDEVERHSWSEGCRQYMPQVHDVTQGGLETIDQL